MSIYGQFCPLAQATQLLCERWTLLVIRELIAGGTRFGELQRGVPLMSPSLLSKRLKQLIDAEIIEARGVKGNYSYHLTQAGEELRPIVELMGAWGHRWVRSNLEAEDLDASLLMWDMRRSIDVEIFSPTRLVVHFQYPDAPRGQQDWWLVSENGEVDLCLNDPGYDVDVVVSGSLKSMTEVWICERKFSDAVKAGDITALGDARIINKLQDWLRSSALSRLGTVEKLPELRWES